MSGLSHSSEVGDRWAWSSIEMISRGDRRNLEIYILQYQSIHHDYDFEVIRD
jgi:hypothetical protein